MDNYYQKCPAKMSDSRLFTDWKTSTRTEEYVKYINGITRDDDYRMFLQENGSKIMAKEWDVIKNRSQCRQNECVHFYPTRVAPSTYYEERMAYNKTMAENHRKNINTCVQLNDYNFSSTSDTGNTLQSHLSVNMNK